MPKTVLVVDGDEETRVTYQKELHAEGYQVVPATNCDEAIRELHSGGFDAVVVKMQSEHDLEYLNEIVQLDRNVKVVLYSERPEFKMDFQTWIADAFLTKPTDPSKIKDALEQLLSPGEES